MASLGDLFEEFDDKDLQAVRGQIAAAASPEFLAGTAAKLQPIFKELIAANLGPQFQQRIATNLARRGATSTGLGTALQNAALGFPGFAAFSKALGSAQDIQKLLVGGLSGTSFAPGQKTSDVENIANLASTFFTIRNLTKGNKDPDDPFATEPTITSIGNRPVTPKPPLFPEF